MEHDITVEIDAGLDAVWTVLTDVERWPEWTRSTQNIVVLGDGRELQVGTRARVKQPRLPAVVWEVTVFEPSQTFVSQTRAGGVASVAAHRLKVGDRGTVVVDLAIRQSGPLAPLAARPMSRLTRRYLRMEADGLKLRSETGDSCS
ncbi:MAG: SRPBCC family protein [Acidimicrobiia bacterium]